MNEKKNDSFIMLNKMFFRKKKMVTIEITKSL